MTLSLFRDKMMRKRIENYNNNNNSGKQYTSEIATASRIITINMKAINLFVDYFVAQQQQQQQPSNIRYTKSTWNMANIC